MADVPETPTPQDRSSCLKELLEFTENCKKQLNQLFETLGWTPDFVNGSTQEVMEVCPYDSNHRVPVRTLERHKAACLLRRMGYSNEELAAMNVYDDKASQISSFTMDEDTQQQVIHQARASAPMIRMEGLYSQGDFSKDPPAVPQNHKRQVCDLTVADRVALYDHVASKRQEQAATNNEDLYVDLVAKLKKGDNQNGPKSHLEKMAEMRDYKRRRQSYRAKNVHITKKSYTEVIREVIDVHAEELSRQWEVEERPEERSSRHSSQRRRTSEDRRSASTESRRSYLGSRDAGGRKRRHSPERGRRHSPERGRRHSPERAGRHSPERAGRHSPERAGHHSPERAGHHSPERAGRHSPERAGRHSPERAGHHSPERAGHHSPERAGHHSPERAGRHSPERGPEHSTMLSREHSRDKESKKKKKKKRKRDSRSPEEQHDRKKRKKKKEHKH